MLVYRICDKKEVETLLKEKSLENIASRFRIDGRLNTHQYDREKKYLHFFGQFGDIFYYDSSKKIYICTYNIVKSILEQSKGHGFYLDRITNQYPQSVIEYAIDSDLISFKNLRRIDKMKRRIFYDDYLEEEYKKKLITVYEKSNGAKKKILVP